MIQLDLDGHDHRSATKQTEDAQTFEAVALFETVPTLRGQLAMQEEAQNDAS